MEGRVGKLRRLNIPSDYLERVYAGVLGKVIGVYMGRPFEGWTHQRILKELGHVRYFVNERLGVPIVVTDDDVSGTFTFVRVLEEHQPTLRGAEDVGRTWLNNIIKDRTVFWWGGNGVSTEHTAFLNLKNGIRPPMSGSTRVNGKTIAEQIGGQIFIDGFAMAAPGQPAVAAILAGSAASVSHDGDALAAARMWAAMEAEAFVSNNVEHLLDTGMRFLGSNGLIRTMINDVRAWCEEDKDWLKTRQRIEDYYGYDKFPGICHVIPNHAIMIMTFVYAASDFGEAMHIVNTCGWDTDCNSGNVGCLIAIMNGISAFDDGKIGKTRGAGGLLDWRGPLADRVLISSADGGYSVNNAARIAYDITNMGRRLAGEQDLIPPKNGAQFHFTLPGSVQGFRTATTPKYETKYRAFIEQGVDRSTGYKGLSINFFGLEVGEEALEVMTDTFAPPEVRQMEFYELACSPLVYPGQTLKTTLKADRTNTARASVRLILRAYEFTDEFKTLTSDPIIVTPGASQNLEWVIPESLGCLPVQAIGLSISHGYNTKAAPLTGTIWVDYMCWTGSPKLTLLPVDSKVGPRSFYKQSFVNATDVFNMMDEKFIIAQDSGEGMVCYGTREWTDYRVTFNNFVITGNRRTRNGVVFRVNGLRRYYGFFFVQMNSNKKGVVLAKTTDESTFVLSGQELEWQVDVPYTINIATAGHKISASIENENIEFSWFDDRYPGGGIGLVVNDGSALVGSIEIRDVRLVKLYEGRQ
ncbi:ADP-ribosylglycohydrolase [Annulohypoxylon maeteangense]|uniref:ADP-ribosylglycohydrolase n=1 Tax=Annulohypoxylon maeteangense TaxID=1927788 RepID=UPI0020083B42|nr:ADP-ribosylglycohydrolase [Annulohypoxylon maeteangense]KAI0886979.1 ADP-ribosylglycohydrolase [Annulohypoxylon maeteangense]